MNSDQTVTIIELRRLLHELRDKSSHVGIRFRMIGEMWHLSHQNVIRLSDAGVVLYDGGANKIRVISDLRRVMQFELDGRFQNYQPHVHYGVTTDDIAYSAVDE